MSLYLKYRPTTLAEVKGNKGVLSALENMLSDLDTCPHTFLMTGPTGCGKTTIARIIADRLGCSEWDFREVNSADFRGIEMVREIRDQAQLKPSEGPCKVWLIDECHQLSRIAENALLKLLEDTPKHVYFILCTTDPQSLLATTKGRCSIFDVKPLGDLQMKRLLREIVIAEEGTVDAEVYTQIIKDSEGHARNALQVLDKVLRVPPEEQLEVAKAAERLQIESIELCKALLNNKSWKAIQPLLKGLKADNEDPEGIRRHVLGFAAGALLQREDNLAGLVLEEFVEPFWKSGFPGLVLACYTVTKN